MRIDKNLVAIIFGGALGLGKGTIQFLTKKQVKVVIADVLQKEGSQVAKNNQCDFVKTNVAEEQQVKALFQYVLNKYGKIDVVLNCAAIFYQSPIIKQENGQIRVDCSQNFLKLLKINVIGTFNIDKWAAKHMSVQKENQNNQRGVIINVASISGFQGSQRHTAYSSTKGAILGMSLPLARDLGRHKIRVMTIAPGLFHSRMTQMPDSLRKLNYAASPLGRFGEAREFAMLVQNIIENPFATGAIWNLNGAFRVPYL